MNTRWEPYFIIEFNYDYWEFGVQVILGVETVGIVLGLGALLFEAGIHR